MCEVVVLVVVSVIEVVKCVVSVFGIRVIAMCGSRVISNAILLQQLDISL